MQTEPKTIVSIFYEALYSGELQTLKKWMTHKSYFMTLESFGLRVALKDESFKKAMKTMEEDKGALVEVEHKLRANLKSRKTNPKITIVSVEHNGEDRQTVRYTENGKDKILYFSKHGESWKIDYYAGRKVA